MPVPTTWQDSSCRSRPSITPVIPVPLPKSGVTVWRTMKFTIRILNKEKPCLEAALGYRLVLCGSGKRGREGRRCALKPREAREGEMWAVRSHQLWTWKVKEGSVENEKPGTAVNRAEKWMLVWRTVSAGCWKSAQHPPGGIFDILVVAGGWLPAVGLPAETLVFPEDVLRGTDSIKELCVLNFLVRGRDGLLKQGQRGREGPELEGLGAV